MTEHVVVDRLQGGAGTSTNMNVNEVLANRALQILGLDPGDHERVSPLDDLNIHQSTNDTYPTALRLAAIWQLRRLEERLVALQEAGVVAVPLSHAAGITTAGLVFIALQLRRHPAGRANRP